MTPSLAAVYDDLVAEASRHEETVAEIRSAFERLGPFSPTDAWFEERSAALWDRVLIDPRIGAALASSAHAQAVQQLGRAQRGLFEVHPHEGTVDMICVVRGGAFRLAPVDDAARAMCRGGASGAGGWIDGHVVATTEGVALLPGFLVHAAEATEPMRGLIATDTPFDELLDSLLLMRHRLASLSRMRAKQVYRATGR
jgi:hypothetical protein